MIRCQMLQDIPDTSQVSFHKNKINLPVRGAENALPVQANTLDTI
jgi:hypothetical protein